MRYFVEASYLGTNYVGWQRQHNGVSVQQVIEEALTKILRDTIEIVGCGRTDAGVHSEYYVFHFDFSGELPADFIRKFNRYLPGDIAFRSVREVHGDLHARYSASSRSYKYYLSLQKIQ